MTLGRATRVLSCAHALFFLFPPQFLDDRARGAAMLASARTPRSAPPSSACLSVQTASGLPSSHRRAAQPQLPRQPA